MTLHANTDEKASLLPTSRFYLQLGLSVASHCQCYISEGLNFCLSNQNVPLVSCFSGCCIKQKEAEIKLLAVFLFSGQWKEIFTGKVSLGRLYLDYPFTLPPNVLLPPQEDTIRHPWVLYGRSDSWFLQNCKPSSTCQTTEERSCKHPIDLDMSFI